MKDQNKSFGQVSRRKFVGTAAVTAAAFSVFPLTASANSSLPSLGSQSSKPMSKYNGVQFGCITYSFRGLAGGIENVLKACVDANCSSIELMPTGIEAYCGAPAAPVRAQQAPAAAPAAAAPGAAPVAGAAPAAAARPAQAAAGAPGAAPAAAGAPAGAPAGGFQRTPLTPEQQAAQDKYVADLKTWRMTVPMTKFEALRKMFNDAGVEIHIVKWEPSRWSDEEIDYAFRSAKALGAKAVCEEISLDGAKKLGPIAAKHGMYAIFHNHMQFATEGYITDVLEPALASSPAVMMNFDMGHYYGSTGLHPNGIIDKYKDRIFSVHFKDKTGPKTTPPNTNQVWGQGETPVKEVLLNIRDKKYPMYCDIELEYAIPVWSDSVKETRKCVEFAKNILMG